MLLIYPMQYTIRITVSIIFLLTLVNEVSIPFSFAVSTKFVIYKDRHLHIPKPKLEVAINESLHSGRYTLIIRYTNEGKGIVHSKQ